MFFFRGSNWSSRCEQNFQGDRLKQLLDAMEESQDFQVGNPVGCFLS